MAFDPLPPSWIALWSEDGATVSFPIAAGGREVIDEA